MQGFTLTQPGGLRMRYVPANDGGYFNTDAPERKITWETGWGWVARDPGTGRVAQMSLDLPPALQGARPPLGRWASEAGICELSYE